MRDVAFSRALDAARPAFRSPGIRMRVTPRRNSPHRQENELITTNAITGTIAAGVTALMTAAAAPASATTTASTATWTQTIGACSSSGDHAACALNVQASRPAIMRVLITATPGQAIKGQYSFQCSNRNHGAGTAGAFDSLGPLSFTLRPKIANPVTCSLSLQGHLPGAGKLAVSVTATNKR